MPPKIEKEASLQSFGSREIFKYPTRPNKTFTAILNIEQPILLASSFVSSVFCNVERRPFLHTGFTKGQCRFHIFVAHTVQWTSNAHLLGSVCAHKYSHQAVPWKISSLDGSLRYICNNISKICCNI